jgi:hypothetical protein
MSTSANVVTLRPADEWSDRLAALLERRAELEAEVRLVSAPEATRAAAAASLSKAEAELATLDRLERAAWSDWAENPTVSEQPTPRHEERRALEQRRSLAAADLRGADAAVAAVQGRLNQLGAEMRQLGPQIYECRLETAMTEVPEIERQILDSHKLMHEQLARLRGLHLAIVEEKAAASSRGDQLSAMTLQEALEQVESLKQPPPAPNWGVSLEHAAAWRAALR